MSSVASLVRPIPKPRIDPADIITAEAVAEIFQCSKKLIYTLARRGELPHYHVPGSRFIRFLRSEIIDHMLQTGQGA